MYVSWCLCGGERCFNAPLNELYSFMWYCTFVHPCSDYAHLYIQTLRWKWTDNWEGLILCFFFFFAYWCRASGWLKKSPKVIVPWIYAVIECFCVIGQTCVRRLGLEMPDLTLCPLQLVRSPHSKLDGRKLLSLCPLSESAKALISFFFLNFAEDFLW